MLDFIVCPKINIPGEVKLVGIDSKFVSDAAFGQKGVFVGDVTLSMYQFYPPDFIL